ncbi:hypothetical protein [Clostridium sp. AM58-1XD]|uniref:hypothetical protein n=1 Tax=Clostridium sp. AM58-1XD TaxID=2292307 RepID=UPI000E53AEC1|nr:hypothetical protein [Clostridium sp. AM58-1XD]RGY96367.1 hypothetical protein DXA13_17380 [Clostridium sp. AM58-1XD]
MKGVISKSRCKKFIIDKKWIKRSTAVLLASAMTFPSMAAPVPVTTDETAYVLLDYDGKVRDVSIVKACDLNGNNTVTDYGSYGQVKNMTTEDEPEIRDDGVTWKINGIAPRKFYYEVKPENEFLDVPWNVEVSYKLNGVPTDPQKLAGASGLVAVDVHVVPNEAADDYFKNNFMLMAGMVSDTEDDLSFTAPGAQFQTFGSYQAAIFMAFPKKEETFHFEIGTDSFENMGVLISMLPVTMSQMDDIADIREHKENIEDAGNAMDEIMNDMLDMMGDMTEDTDQTIAGLERLDKAREEAHSYRNDTDASLEEIKASISRLEATMTDFAAIVGDTKLPAAVRTMGRGLEDISSAVNSIMGKMETMVDAMDNIQNTLDKIKRMTDMEQKAQMMEKLKQEVEALQQQMGAMQESGELDQLAGGIQDWLDSLEDAGLVHEGTVPHLATPSEIDMPILDLDEVDEYAGLLEDMASSMIYETKRMTNSMSRIVDKGDDLVDGIDTMVDGIFDTADELDSILKVTSDTMVDTSGLLGSMRNTLDIIDRTGRMRCRPKLGNTADAERPDGNAETADENIEQIRRSEEE